MLIAPLLGLPIASLLFRTGLRGRRRIPILDWIKTKFLVAVVYLLSMSKELRTKEVGMRQKKCLELGFNPH